MTYTAPALSRARGRKGDRVVRAADRAERHRSWQIVLL